MLDEVLERLHKNSRLLNGAELKRAQSYMNCQMRFFDLSVPAQRKLAATPYSFVKRADYKKPSEVEALNEIAQWEKIWHTTDIFEVRSQALLSLEYLRKSDWVVSAWKPLSSWAASLNNWAHSEFVVDLCKRARA